MLPGISSEDYISRDNPQALANAKLMSKEREVYGSRWCKHHW